MRVLSAQADWLERPIVNYFPNTNLPLLKIWSNVQIRHKFYSSLVSRIYDVLLGARIQIQIRGSVPLDSGSGSCFFLKWLPRCQQNIYFSYYLLAVGTITSVFKDNNNNTTKSRYFACFWKDPDPYKWLRIRSPKNGSGTLLLSVRIIQYGSCCTLYSIMLADSCLLS